MFFDFGAGEIIGLAILAMVLVGPDKLPHFAVEAAKVVKKLRGLATTATNELKENLGPGFEDLKPADLNPKTFVKKQIESALDEGPAKPKVRPEHKIDPDLLSPFQVQSLMHSPRSMTQSSTVPLPNLEWCNPSLRQVIE